MEEKKVTSNQVGLILILFTIGLKFSVLPAIMCSYASNNAYIVCLIAIILDFLCTILVLSIIKKLPDIDFFQLITQTLSKPVAIIIFTFLMLFFLAKCLLSLLELHDYFIATLFDDLNPLFFIITLMLLMLYLFSKNLRTYGRILELTFWPIAIGLIFTLFFPIKNIELINLFPIFSKGFNPIWQGIIHTTLAFGDYMVLLILMGKIEYDQKSTKRILLYQFFMLIFVLAFYIIFIGTFGKTAINQTIALGELPLHNPYPSTIGKLEWLIIILWTGLIILESALLGKCSSFCISKIINKPNSIISPIIITIILSLLYPVTYLRLESAIDFATNSTMITITSLFQVFIIILLYISYFIYKKKGLKYANKS